MTSDRIELRGLAVLGRCGVGGAERAVPQPLEIDLDVDLDLSAAALSDELPATVDYASLCDVVSGAVAAGAVALLEHLAEGIARAVLAADGRVEQVEVAVRKVRPPVAHHLATAGVRLVRHR